MKKLLSVILACLMIVSMTSFAGAIPQVDSEDYLIERPDGSRVVAAYRYRNGVREELSKTEYLEMIESNKPFANMAPERNFSVENIQPHGIYDFYTYNEIYSLSEVEMNGMRRRISNYVRNSGSAFATRTIFGSISLGAVLDTSLTAKEEEAIEFSLGVSLSAEFSFSDSISYQIPPSTKVWMEFTPIMDYTYGTVEHWVPIDAPPYTAVLSTTTARVYLPRVIMNELDGIVEIVEDSM